MILFYLLKNLDVYFIQNNAFDYIHLVNVWMLTDVYQDSFTGLV